MSDGTSSSNYEARVAATRKRFVYNLEERLVAILLEVNTDSSGSEDESGPRKLHRLLHDLAGNAAMLELGKVSGAILPAVEIAERADTMERIVTPDEKAKIEAAIAETRVIAAQLREQC